LARELAITATSELFARVIETPAVQALARRLEDGGVLSCAGVSPAAQPFLAALLRHRFPSRPIVVVTDGLKTQETFHQDLATWGGQFTVHGSQIAGQTSKTSQPVSSNPEPMFYPSWEILPHDSRLPHIDVISERLETLVALTQLVLDATGHASRVTFQAPPTIVTSVIALLQRTFPPQFLRAHTRVLSRGDRIDPLDLVEWLEDQGYEPEAQVTQKGELALRGGILDIYPLTSPWPVRLEFFGDELESLRHFDPFTQVSREEIGLIALPPAGELGVMKKSEARSPKSEGSSNGPVGGRTTERLGTLLEYLPSNTIWLLCEPEQLTERADDYAGQIPEQDPFFVPWEEFQQQAIRAGMTLVEVAETDSCRSRGEERLDESEVRSSKFEVRSLKSEVDQSLLTLAPTVLFASLDAFRPLVERAPEPQVAEAQRREFFDQLHRWLRRGYALHVFCNNDGERQRFAEIWNELDFDTSPPARPPAGEEVTRFPLPASLSTNVGSLSRGFLYDDGKLVVVTDAEIFGRYKVQRPRRLKSPHAQATRSALDIDFTHLEEGDYVVHIQHGISRYLGLQVLPTGLGRKNADGSLQGDRAEASAAKDQECLVLEYAPGLLDEAPPKLYVPVTEAHLVSKYVGVGKARPALSVLGGLRWTKLKQQAERAIRDVAGELLAIQAARASQPGHAFAFDNPWQREFEGAFLFEETPDQMAAIVETKADMERPKPMDRLICGDVGFGKTEVGIRAAFKAVMDGKQVAILVPTTVLAQQHYNTFRERMADYPVRIELLSRFRTRRAQEQVVKDLAAGGVDIVIGTHRLLQADIAFKDLGLVVIDEEQRFGVLHKEKFKMLRQLVDVLTLSATPIPRTLYLALTGARDMSTIQTPPHDRLPVETIVTEYDERIIRDAIQRELNRGGQVFFLHNRVLTIGTMAQKLQNLVPDARIVVGHGQMHSDDLEEVMTAFVNGQADILLSTTIIESGLDIPNANTIIIDRADRFGLSDLYQLRGRVGRYKHQAYAYLLLPRHAGLLADVRKRLSAMKQYSTLGSGFKIAMRDLEIRGAGNLLGSEQSGHITAVGFDLYCQLLKQSVASLKGEKVKPRVQVQVQLDFMASSSIPFNYISDSRQRIEVYRKLAEAGDKAALQALEQELRDRFGPLPPAMLLLLQIGELKTLAAERDVTVIEVKEDKLMLTRNNDFVMVGSKFPRLTKKEAPARLKEIKKLLLAL
jgi:transcription-repair coupling factor (superfamily II helicase)